MSYNYRSISNTPEERAKVTHPYCFWEEAFTSEELEKICEIFSGVALSDASVASTKENSDDPTLHPALEKGVRRSKVSFHTLNENNRWVFERLNAVIGMVNDRWYNFDLNGYSVIQYTEYHGDDHGCYDWHTDLFMGSLPAGEQTETRKLSLTCLLNDPIKDFDGGDLQFGHESNFKSAEMKKGTMILFPSFNLHRVSPVTRGVRKSMVVWVVGPKFK